MLLSYEYLTDQWNPEAHWPVWNPIQEWPAINPWWVVVSTLSFGWVLSGFAQWQVSNRRMLIQTRKNWYLLLLMGTFILPSIFFPKGNVYEGITLLLLPASAFGAYAFLGDAKRGFKILFFWLLIAACAVIAYAVLNQKM
jgi:hypothetical protein